MVQVMACFWALTFVGIVRLRARVLLSHSVVWPWATVTPVLSTQVYWAGQMFMADCDG